MSIFSKVKDRLQEGKDFSASMLARKLVEERFAKYGRIQSLALDSKKRRLKAELLLKGESEPLFITVQNYDLIRDGHACSVVIREAIASKPWVNQALNDFVVGHAFAVPAKYSKMVGLLL